MLHAFRMHYFISSSVISSFFITEKKAIPTILSTSLTTFPALHILYRFFSSEFIVPETGFSLREVFIMKVALKSVS